MAEQTAGQQDQSLAPTRPQPINQPSNRDFSQDLRVQAQQYGQQAVETLNKAKDRATEYWGQANDKLKDLQGKDFSQITEEAKDYARRKPGQALLITAAAGVVLGFLIRGGRR